LGSKLQYLAINEQQTLYFCETGLPEISHDECLIKVRAIGVNRADILQKQGKYPAPAGESEIIGIEACGDIVVIGESSTLEGTFAINDKVFAIVPGGAYAEYVKVKTAHLFQLPTNFTYVEGAAIAEAYLTAYQCLFFIADLKPHSKVLIHAGASGVGSAAIQLAKGLDCHVTVTVGNEEKVLACKALGADEVINYQRIDFVKYSKEKKQDYDVIVDVVAGPYVNKNISVCALDGHIVMLSMLGGRYAESIDVAKMLLKRLNITATTLRNRSDEYKNGLVNAFKADFYPQLKQGVISPVIYQQSPWQKAESAHKVMMNNENVGKLILTIND
jgi:putative PIG3 family NAD(P)H quinone oxidoreductase